MRYERRKGNGKEAIFLPYQKWFQHPESLIDYHIWCESTTTFHSHDFYELFIVLEGSLQHYIGNKKEELRQGMFRFVRPQEAHYQISVRKDTRTFNIGFAPQLTSEISEFSGVDFKRILDLENSNGPFLLQPEEFELIRQQTKQLLISENVPTAKLIILLCADRLSSAVRQFPEILPDDIRSFVDFISDPNNFHLKVSEMCKQANYSQSMLILLFHKYFGKSIIEYVQDIKIRYACSLLKSTNYTILNISSAIGIDSLSHFNHLFKAKMGMTPSQYRKEYHKRLTRPPV